MKEGTNSRKSGKRLGRAQPSVELGAVCNFVGGSQPPKQTFVYKEQPGYIRLIQIQDYKTDNRKTYIPKDKARRFCKKNDVMIGRYGPPIFQILRGLEGSYNVALMKAQPINEEELDKEYLFYFLQSRELFDYVVANSERTAGQDGVRKELLETYPIPLPSLEEQRRIADIAMRADRLRRTRCYGQQLSETYLQSVFLEMFGNKNFEFPNVSIEAIAAKSKYSLSSGPFGSNLTSAHYKSYGVPVLRGVNIDGNSINLDNIKYISEEKAQELVRSQIYPDDVVIVAVGSSGRACQVPLSLSRAVMSQNFNKITPDKEKILSTYLTFCINSPIVQNQISHEITDTVRTFFSLTKLKTVEIPLPPLPLQQKFAAIVQRFERLRSQQREGDRQAEHLFQSILHRAFRGEL